MKKLILIAIFAFSVQNTFAQNPNPFKSIGKPAPEFLSLTNGKYPEIFENDTLRKIGSVIFNTRTNKIEYFIETDTMYSEATLQPEIVSRWLSIDPLARKYASLSPYNFVNNNPILNVDFDGRYFIVKNQGDRDKVRAALALAFNGSSDAITFDKRGKLTIDESKIHGELNQDQKFLLAKVQDIATDSGIKVKIKTVSKGGNYTQPKAIDPSTGKITKAVILLNVNHPLVDAKMKDTKDGTLRSDDPNFQLSEDQTRADILFHEIGHVSEDRSGNLIIGDDQQSLDNDQKTVGFENFFRRIIRVNERVGNLHGDNDGDGVYENKGSQQPSPVKQ